MAVVSRVTVVVGAIAALSVLACRPGVLRGGGGTAPSTPSTAQAQSHTYTFIDDARGKRTVKTEVYLPVGNSGPLPIVLFSHGLRGLPSDYRGLWSVWVDAISPLSRRCIR
jgi:predicted dienelactone hydrolase